MVKKSFESSVKQYWNKPLRQLQVKAEDGTLSQSKVRVLPVSGEYDAFESYEEIEEAHEGPSKSDVLKWKNARLLAAAKAKAALAQVTAAGFVEPTAENDPMLQLRGFYDMFLANLRSKGVADAEAQARIKASEASGIAWPEDDDDIE